ncbi:MAG TPA: hypothetical protein VEM76_18135 [Anaeromyxobacteraceae bacterium]|nr:hypothetical protein [Anaeromyxobacteraceae bacterium]
MSEAKSVPEGFRPIDIQKVGARLAFASCYLVVGTRRILRASGVFALVPPARPKESFEG